MKLIDEQIITEASKSYSSFAITRLLNSKVDYLLRQDREEEAVSIIKENLEYPDFREMLANRSIYHGDFDHAKSLCQEGIEIAKKEGYSGNPVRWQKKLYEIAGIEEDLDRKSTRLNSSHVAISYAVFCLKKKKEEQ